MKRFKKILVAIVFILLMPVVGLLIITYYGRANITQVPHLQSGDLIFQTALTNQTPAILFATGSTYSHVGIVNRSGKEVTVIHAGQHVMESSLADFIKSGWGQQFTVMRYDGVNNDLTDTQREAIVKQASHYLGHPYNYVFHMGTEAVYCSELPYLAFKQSHVPLGTLQTISELNMNNFAVKKLFDERWKMHPSCQAPDMTAERCWKTIMDEPIITPVQLSRDPHLVTLYSNYWY